MNPRFTLQAILGCLTATLLVGIFTLTVIALRSRLTGEIRQTIINRDTATLLPVALRQLAQRESDPEKSGPLLAAVLESAQQENILAVAVYDAEGKTLHFAPDSLLFPELPINDYLRLLRFASISRYHPEFLLSRYFSGTGNAKFRPTTPVLEVMLPLQGRVKERILGFAHYYIDARALASELAITERRINRQTSATLGIGGALIILVMAGAYFGLSRSHKIIALNNAQLLRTNFELTLSAKASALGQITSHLIHDLQGSVGSLRSVISNLKPDASTAADWATAASYIERMQTMIQEAVALLGDSASHTAYELTGYELAAIIRQRNEAAAAQKGVLFSVQGGFDHGIDSHRGGLLCLIANNLIQNALEATERGSSVIVHFHHQDGTAILRVIVSVRPGTA